MFGGCLGDVWGMFGGCLGDVLGMFRDILGMFQGRFGNDQWSCLGGVWGGNAPPPATTELSLILRLCRTCANGALICANGAYIRGGVGGRSAPPHP